MSRRSNRSERCRLPRSGREPCAPVPAPPAHADDPSPRPTSPGNSTGSRAVRLRPSTPGAVPTWPSFRLWPSAHPWKNEREAAKALRRRTLTNLYNAHPQWLADGHFVPSNGVITLNLNRPATEKKTEGLSTRRQKPCFVSRENLRGLGLGGCGFWRRACD